MQEQTPTNSQNSTVDFASAVEFLLENGYLAYLSDKVVITNKFTREFNPLPRPRAEQLFPDKPEVVSREDIWNKFMADAEVPHRATFSGDGKQYTIRQFSLKAANNLIKVIKSVPDYKVLVEATKAYYKSNSYKLTFTNYLERRVWKQQYDQYEKALKEGKLREMLARGSGSNKFED